jgi:hypothetical protein
MREAGGAKDIKKIEDSNGKSENGNMSTDISPDKQTTNNILQ